MIKIDIDKCIGCCTCELVCSYHHKKCFNPIFSSIRVNFKDNYDINIVTLDTCDYNGEGGPFCIKFCPVNAIKLVE